MKIGLLDRYVIGRECNVIRVDFRTENNPSGPTLPGAGAMRQAPYTQPVSIVTTSMSKSEVAA